MPQDFADDIDVDVAPILNESEEKVGDVKPAEPFEDNPEDQHMKDKTTKAVSNVSTNYVDYCYIINIPSSFDAAINSEEAEH